MNFQVLNLLQTEPRIEKAVLYFEFDVWNALEAVLPEVRLQGCSFYWGQAVLCKVGNELNEMYLLAMQNVPVSNANSCRQLHAKFMPSKMICNWFYLIEVYSSQWCQ